MAFNPGTTSNVYDIGDDVRLSVLFQVEGVPADPTTVIVKILAPDGTSTTLTYETDAALHKASTGSYYAIYNPQMSGRFKYRWTGSGAVNASDEDEFRVPPRTVS